jgi:hypothetical protein
MLTHEWRELETLCDRIIDRRHRYAAAYQSKHPGQVEALRSEITKLLRQREQLVQHIAARLGSATGERSHPAGVAGRRSPARDADPQRTGASAETPERLPAQ